VRLVSAAHDRTDRTTEDVAAFLISIGQEVAATI
jgi:hypothetical protein